MNTFYFILQLSIGLILGAVIACSPTKFSNSNSISNTCSTDSTVTNCIVEQGFLNLTQRFTIGTGKTDILFVIDNSASMSTLQRNIANRFNNFIQQLDAKNTDYRIAITTTDVSSGNSAKLLQFANGNTFLTSKDDHKVNLFNAAITREETRICEDYIISMFNTYGPTFQSMSIYANQYKQFCPSPDTRGIFATQSIISSANNAFLRTDANLNIILISNDDARQGKILLEDKDQADYLTNYMSQQLPTKFWNFNSIVVKDSNCKLNQSLKNYQGVLVTNEFDQPAISGGIGNEYIKLSNSATKDIDNNPAPRGQILNICDQDYAQHFQNMASQITNEARMIHLKCIANKEPVITNSSGQLVDKNLYKWNQDQITFSKGTEGMNISVQYKCYTGPK